MKMSKSTHYDFTIKGTIRVSKDLQPIYAMNGDICGLKDSYGNEYKLWAIVEKMVSTDEDTDMYRDLKWSEAITDGIDIVEYNEHYLEESL